MARNIKLERPERFEKPHVIPQEKIDRAIQNALDKLEKDIPKWMDSFAGTCSVDFKYPQGPNNNWECGMQTGVYWLAYELSGNPKFLEIAQKQTATYRERLDNRVGVDDHDVGFVYSPACVAGYKVTGNEEYRQIALDACDYYYNTSYSKKGGFVLRAWNWTGDTGCRTMMDTMMNAPFLFWCGEQTGNQDYTEAAKSQNKITDECLIREDGSSFHHYQFDVETHKPLYGLTWQGYSDESCWSRGHSWAVYGYPIAYSYCKEEYMVQLHKDITYYMLNQLGDDLIPQWDFIFKPEEDQPRDSSAGAVFVCGMHEMCKYLPDDAPQKAIFESAAAQMLEAIIDNCTGDIGREYDGLIYHVTHALPQGAGIDECAIYGDYFYLEALMRYKNPEWNRYW